MPHSRSVCKLVVHKLFRTPRSLRQIFVVVSVIALCWFALANAIFFLNPYLPDMSCPRGAEQLCLLSLQPSFFAPRCLPAFDALSRSPFWLQAGHPIISDISACTQSFFSGVLDAFGIWPSSLRLTLAAHAAPQQNPFVAVASFSLKRNRRPVCKLLLHRAFSDPMNFVTLLKVDLNSRHHHGSFGFPTSISDCQNASGLSPRQASDLLHLWMAHRHNGFLLPFLNCSVDRDATARICEDFSTRRMVLLVFSSDHLRRGSLMNSTVLTYLPPSLPQPLRRIDGSFQPLGTLHSSIGSTEANTWMQSGHQSTNVAVHMNVCASAAAAVKQALSDAINGKQPVICLPSAACFCTKSYAYQAGTCITTGARFGGLFNCGGSACSMHNRLIHPELIPDEISHHRFAQSYAAQMTPFRFSRDPRHILDLGCGSGCWSLLLAGPNVHVTVIVFDQTIARAALEIVKIRGIQEFARVLLSKANATARASELLQPLAILPLTGPNFFGFEFLVLLDVLKWLSFSAVQELASALKPLMHTRSKALVSVLGISAIALRRVEWYEPDRLEAAMLPLNANVLWCGVVSHALEIMEFGCESCSLIELLLVGTRNAPVQHQRSWHIADFAPIGNQVSARPCGANNNVQELMLRHQLMRMQIFEDHEIFDSLSLWGQVKPWPGGAFYDANFDGRLLVLPNFLRSKESHDHNQVVLCVHMDASRIFLLDIIARSWNGPISVVILVYHHAYHSVIDLVFHAHNASEAAQRWCSIHLVRFAHSPEHYSVNSFRNIAMIFASSLWVVCIDADFVPMRGTRAALQSAVQSHGYDRNGQQLKRAFIVTVLSSRDVFLEPVDFSTVDSSLGDDLDHKFHSFPLPNGVEEHGSRSFQCHGGSDIQRWREATRNSEGMFQIAFSHSMEPYYVIPMRSWATVMYDERFRRWGGDKQSHAHELASSSYQFWVVPGAAIVHQPHPVAQYAWDIDKNIAYDCDIINQVVAKEDTMLFPPEYMLAIEGTCSKHLVLQYAQDESSKLAVSTYKDRIFFYYAQIQQCRDKFAPYYLKQPLPRASVSGALPVFQCTSLVNCH